jgi:hypothetical protein
MENTELIKALRLCAKSGNVIDYCELGDDNDCLYWDNCGDCIDNLLRAAANALESADAYEEAWSKKCERLEKRIAELSLDNKMLKNTIDADKGVMLDRIRFLEAQMPKQAHWVAVENGHGVCSNCNRQDSIDNMATHCRYCGARMTKGEDK